MSLTCTICGSAYVPRGRDNTGFCVTCQQENFAGAEPPVGWLDEEPLPRSLTLTPRQVNAMRRVAERWRQQAEEEGAREDD